MTLRIIAKFFLLLVIIGFFMPMACDQNAFQLIDNGMLKSEGVAAIYAAFILSIIGLIIGVLLLVKKGVPPVIDWVVTVAVAGIVIIMFYYTGYRQGHHDSFQSGVYMALIGAAAALAAQIMSGVKVTVAVHFTKKQAVAACAGVLGCLLLSFLLRGFGVSFLGSVLTLSVVAVMAIIFGGAVGGLIGLVFPFLAFLLGVYYPRFIPLIIATVIGYALLGFLAGIICPKYALGGKQNVFVKSALVLPIILVLVLLTGIIKGLLNMGHFDKALLLSLQQGIVTGIITALSVFVWLKRRKG